MFLFVVIFLCPSVKAQKAKQDCYTTYKTQGDVYQTSRSYDLAIQQYQNAKYCNGLTTAQRRTLDSLIVDCGNKKRTIQKPMTKRF